MKKNLMIIFAIIIVAIVLSSAVVYYLLSRPTSEDRENRVLIFPNGSSPDVAADGRNVVVVAVAGNILIATSRDKGQTWNHSEFKTNSPASCPGISLSNGTIHMAWYERVNDSFVYELKYSKSVDLGKSWSPTMKITAAAFPQEGDLSILAYGYYVHIAFLLGSGNHGESGYVHSLDGGLKWQEPITMSNPDGKESKDPRLCGTPGNLYYIWFDSGNLTGSGLRYSRDNGDTWSAEKEVIWGVFTTIAAHGNTVVVAANILQAPTFCKSTDCGLTWTTEKKISDYEGYKNALDAVSDDLYIFSRELYKDGNDYLVYSYTRDGGQSWKEKWISASSDIEYTQSAIAHSDVDVFLVWEDKGIHLLKLETRSLKQR